MEAGKIAAISTGVVSFAVILTLVGINRGLLFSRASSSLTDDSMELNPNAYRDSNYPNDVYDTGGKRRKTHRKKKSRK